MAGRSRTSEVDRLHRVYEDYDADGSAQARWSLDNPGNRAIHAERARRATPFLAGAVGPVLDLGCGEGRVLTELRAVLPTGARVGVDLRLSRLVTAAAALPEVAFARAEGSALPFPAGAFELVLAFTLFSSILDPSSSVALVAEVDRVLRPGGQVLWYDLRRANPNNPEVRALNPADVAGLFPGWTTNLRPVTVLPPLTRRLGPATGALYPVLAHVRPLATHLLGTVAKPA